ncbi:unnamed protein product [Microthlaspi erraticum]|uniref:RNA polymerase III subunit C6 n=1 Tax=Microthlaspi erraticum TaxID=1685480 RepID=A0A6D2I4L7_9BRAS|nr:unnamed protein product [Microthlaspi erraticum]
MSSLKRKRADNDDEKKILAMILSKQGMGATPYDIKAATSIQGPLVTKALKSLKTKKLIKDIQNMNNKGIKHFFGFDVEPCKALTGGDWYTDGQLDLAKIEDLKKICVTILSKSKKKVVTFDLFVAYFEKTNNEMSREQTKEILKNLVLDNVVMEVKSNGMNEYAGIRIGEICYRLTGKKAGDGGEARAGAFASVPCGACPHIGLCSPGGAISPTTCSYFQKWLDF